MPYLAWLASLWAGLDFEYTITCLLSMPVALGLAFLARDRLEPGPSWRGGWLLVGSGMCLHMLSLLLSAPSLAGIGLPVAVVGAIGVWRGRSWARHLTLPVSFLLFLMPIPWLLRPSLAVPVQSASAKLAYSLLVPTGLDVDWRGVYVFTPNYYIEVADTCSGLHSATALLMFGIVIAHLLRLPTRAQVFLVALVLPAGLFINGARVAFLLLMGHGFGKGAATGTVHDVSAVLFFLVAYAALSWLARRLASTANPAIASQTIHEKTSPAA